jgi:hypothetical protein
MGTKDEEIVKAATAVVESVYKSIYNDNGCSVYRIMDSRKCDSSEHVAFIISQRVETYQPVMDADYSMVVVVSPSKSTRRVECVKNTDSRDHGWYEKKHDYRNIKAFSTFYCRDNGPLRITVVCADGSETIL